MCTASTSAARAAGARLGAPAASAGGYTAGDEVSKADRLGQRSVQARAPDELFGVGQREARPLHEEAGDGFRCAGSFDEPPLASSPAYPRFLGSTFEERAADALHVRPPSNDDEHRQLERLVDGMNVDDVEAADGDALKKHGMQVPPKAGGLHDFDQAARRVRTVAANTAGDDAVQSRSRAHRANEEHVAPMLAVERRIIETDDVGIASHSLEPSYKSAVRSRLGFDACPTANVT